MSGLAGKVDVKNMMKGDEKDTTGKKDTKKEKALAKGLKESTVDNDKKDKKEKDDNNKDKGDVGDNKNIQDNTKDKKDKKNGKDNQNQNQSNNKQVKVDLNNVKQLSELLEENIYLCGDKLSTIDIQFIKK